MANRKWTKAAAGVGALAMALGWAHGAVAQETVDSTESTSSSALPDVVVTARRVTENLQDTAVGVTQLSGETLETRGIRDLGEITKLSSSLNFDSNSDVRAGMSIRGVGRSSDVNAAPGVGLFIDGVYQPSSAQYTVPFFDAERIEVLRGPQGTLYGKNTMGGAVSVISRDPSGEFGTNFSLERSTGNTTVANVSVDAPLVGDVLGNRTSVFYRDTDGLQDNQVTHNDPSTRHDIGVRSRFLFEPNDTYRSALSLFYADLQSNPFPYSETTPARGLNHPVDNIVKDLNGLINSEYRGANLTNTFDFGSVVLTSLTSYDRSHVTTIADTDFTATAGLRTSGYSRRDNFSQELRLASDEDSSSNLSWLVGGYYDNEEYHTNSRSEVNFLGWRTISSGDRHESGETFAGFGQATLIVNDFEFVAGLRYDHQTRVSDNSSLSRPGGNFFLPLVRTHLDQEVVSEAWQPKLSLSYHFTPDIMGYALAARGFRAGGFNGLTLIEEDRQSYDPEFTTTIEGGLKTELFDRRLRLNFATFHTAYEDVLITDLAAAGETTDNTVAVYSRNGGKARSIGFELEGAWRITPDLTLSGGYTYLDFKNNEVIAPYTQREVTGYAHNTANLSLDYLHEFTEAFSLGAHTSISYIGETPTTVNQTATVPKRNITEMRDAHSTVDASLDFNINNFTVSLFGKNIFDEQYYTSYIGNTINPSGRAIGILNRPAEFGVRLAGRF